jgi:hypothetical protein
LAPRHGDNFIHGPFISIKRHGAVYFLKFPEPFCYLTGIFPDFITDFQTIYPNSVTGLIKLTPKTVTKELNAGPGELKKKSS